MRIDLNADLGETGFELGQDPLSPTYGAPRGDAALMQWITSASVACGFHAGDPGVMRATVRLAREHGVAIGAHPALPDRASFGRRELRVTPDEVENLVVYQIGALAALARVEGVPLQHVKAHGALYNMATRDQALAEAIARATAAVDPSLILFGLPGSELVAAGRRLGLRTACEAFADRAYAPDGTLVPRSEPGAVIDDPEIVVRRAAEMVREGAVTAVDGTRVPLVIDTLCVHGDTSGAATLAASIRRALEQAGVKVVALGAPDP